MDIEEAKQKVNITQEERKAVDGYINVWHTTMNSLASFDVEKYLEESKRGWYLPGAEKNPIAEENPTPEALGEEILSTIDDFAKVYSAMVKYGASSRAPRRLYRGTSNKEARSLKSGETYDRLISTSTATDVAKRFCEYGDPGYLRINVYGNMPFLDVDDFMGMENMNREENEFVLAPFSTIRKAGYADRDRTYTYYDVDLEAPQLRPFEEGEKESFRERIKQDFAKIMDIGRKYKNFREMNEVYWEKYTRSHDREETQYYKEKCDECSKGRQELRPEIEDFTNILKSYIQGLCYEKQREFEEANKIVTEDMEKRAEEARLQRMEDDRRGRISEYNTRVPNTIQNLSSIPMSIESSYEALSGKAMTYAEMSSVLGIPFNSNIDRATIEPYMLASKRNVSKIQEAVSSTSINGDSSLEETALAGENLDKFDSIAGQAISVTSSLSNAVNVYDAQALMDVKRGIDYKVQDIIKRTKMQILSQKKQEVQDRKVSWIGRIFRAQKLKDAELQNIDLQIEFERTKPVVQKGQYSIQDSLADMVAFAKGDLGGNLTPEMQDLGSKVSRYFGVNQAYIGQLADRKLQSKPVPIQNGRRESTKNKIARLTEDSQGLRMGIQDNTFQNTRNGGNMGRYSVTTNEGIGQFMSSLSRISKITEVKELYQDERNQTQGEVASSMADRTTEDLWGNIK